MIDTKSFLSLSSNIKSGKVNREARRTERKEKRKQRRLIRKERRYQKRGNKIVKINEDGNETEVTNPVERMQAVQEINTPLERLPESAKQEVSTIIEENKNIKESKNNFTIFYIIAVIIVILLIIKFVKK